MQIAPVVTERSGQYDPHRRRVAQDLAVGVLDRKRQVTRTGGPDVLARQQSLPAPCRPGDQGDPRRARHFGVGGRRECVDKDLEFELRFDVGLQPQSGRTATRVAQPDRDRLARAQKAAADADRQAVGPRSRPAAIHPAFEHGAIRRLDGRVVRRRGIGKLRLAHVGCCAPGDPDVAGIVDAEGSRGVNEGQRLIGSGRERTGRRDRHRAHVLGQVGSVQHCPL